MKLSLRAALPAAALLCSASFVGAQIERLDLPTMVNRTDGSVVGKIVHREVFRVDHPLDGPELYFTKMTIDGHSSVTGQPLEIEVTFHGGFIKDKNGDIVEGVYNSEAPSEDDVRIGNEVLAFYKSTTNMGGGVAGNALYAAHGGLYRIARSAQGPVVLGRGEGYAVANNVRLDALEQQMTEIRGR
jgi:hypothetical protein